MRYMRGKKCITMSENVEEMLSVAAENLDEVTVEAPFDWDSKCITVRTLLEKYKDGTFSLPLAQRLYVWNKAKRSEFLDSILINLPCGSLTIAEQEGKAYLVDGLQRTTSAMILVGEVKDKAEKSKILNYKIPLVTIHDATNEQIQLIFSRLNSGVAVSAAVKARSALKTEYAEMVAKLSRNDFLVNISRLCRAAYSTSAHNEIIAYNALISAAGLEASENKAKALANCIAENGEVITAAYPQAEKLIAKLESIYSISYNEKTREYHSEKLDDVFISRSFNANFISALLKILVKNEYKDERIRNVIRTIFAGNRSVKDYSATVGSGAGAKSAIDKRVEVITKYLEAASDEEVVFDEKAFAAFCEEESKTIFTTNEGNSIAFSDMNDDEKKALFLAKGNDAENSVEEAAFARVEKTAA